MTVWAIIRQTHADGVAVVVGTWANYDDATEWAKAHSSKYVGCKIVPFFTPQDYDHGRGLTDSVA